MLRNHDNNIVVRLTFFKCRFIRNERAKTILLNILKIYSNVSSIERHHHQSKILK